MLPKTCQKPSVICMLHVMNRCLWWRFVIESRFESRFLMENHLLLVAVEFATSKVGHNGWRQAGRALAFCPLFFGARSIKVKVSGTRRGLACDHRQSYFQTPGNFGCGCLVFVKNLRFCPIKSWFNSTK